MLQTEALPFPASRLVNTRVDSGCVVVPSLIIPVAGGTAYPESPEPGLQGRFFEEVPMAVSWSGWL